MRNSLLALSLFALAAFGQANGKLQIHYIDVGQADSAIVISPHGETVLFDAGEDMKTKDCTKLVEYLTALKVARIDHLYVSHYHFDHIGCVADVLGHFPLRGKSYDRGESYAGATFKAYVAAVGEHRATAQVGDKVVLDADFDVPVTIETLALNGAGVDTKNENDLSVVAKLTFEHFTAEFGGDLSGEKAGDYEDIETKVADQVGPINVYKVHHHCSTHSTNEYWLQKTTPQVGVISTGDTNPYSHPATACLERLHQAGVKTYWTETGKGAAPISTWDVVGGSILVEMTPGADHYTVKPVSGEAHDYPLKAVTPQPTQQSYVWSVRSKIYHYADCAVAKSISEGNRRTGTTPPEGKTLHQGCPPPK
jgi:beta-lactamase superfamily II metal-dependent hydrolase